MFSDSIAAILPELDLWIVLAVLPPYCQKGLLRQYCQKLICMRNPVLPQYCGNILRLPEAVYFGKGWDKPGTNNVPWRSWCVVSLWYSNKAVNNFVHEY